MIYNLLDYTAHAIICCQYYCWWKIFCNFLSFCFSFTPRHDRRLDVLIITEVDTLEISSETISARFRFLMLVPLELKLKLKKWIEQSFLVRYISAWIRTSTFQGGFKLQVVGKITVFNKGNHKPITRWKNCLLTLNWKTIFWLFTSKFTKTNYQKPEGILQCQSEGSKLKLKGRKLITESWTLWTIDFECFLFVCFLEGGGELIFVRYILYKCWRIQWKKTPHAINRIT